MFKWKKKSWSVRWTAKSAYYGHCGIFSLMQPMCPDIPSFAPFDDSCFIRLMQPICPDGYPPTAVGYPPTAVNYPPFAVGYPPTAVGYPPTAVAYPPTAVDYPPRFSTKKKSCPLKNDLCRVHDVQCAQCAVLSAQGGNAQCAVRHDHPVCAVGSAVHIRWAVRCADQTVHRARRGAARAGRAHRPDGEEPIHVVPQVHDGLHRPPALELGSPRARVVGDGPDPPHVRVEETQLVLVPGVRQVADAEALEEPVQHHQHRAQAPPRVHRPEGGVVAQPNGEARQQPHAPLPQLEGPCHRQCLWKGAGLRGCQQCKHRSIDRVPEEEVAPLPTGNGPESRNAQENRRRCILWADFIRCIRARDSSYEKYLMKPAHKIHLPRKFSYEKSVR